MKFETSLLLLESAKLQAHPGEAPVMVGYLPAGSNVSVEARNGETEIGKTKVDVKVEVFTDETRRYVEEVLGETIMGIVMQKSETVEMFLDRQRREKPLFDFYADGVPCLAFFSDIIWKN